MEAAVENRSEYSDRSEIITNPFIQPCIRLSEIIVDRLIDRLNDWMTNKLANQLNN